MRVRFVISIIAVLVAKFEGVSAKIQAILQCENVRNEAVFSSMLLIILTNECRENSRREATASRR